MRAGFSLVELSIVLVILGLLTGGILTGQNLIRAAELRGVVTEFQLFQTATQTFRDKYFALPGDMLNATDFWGATASCPDTAGTGTQTCNGNGNGKILPVNAASEYNEPYTFWQHLANAGLISGTYTGISGAGGQFGSISGENSPHSRTSNASWGVSTYDNTDGSLAWPFEIDFGNNFIVGAECGAGLQNRCEIMTPEEAWGIDKKIDDGKPARGFVVIDGTDATTECANGSGTTDFDADYALSTSSIECSLRFIKSF